jgi:hypothetical protein
MPIEGAQTENATAKLGKYPVRNGLVVLLDALGTRTLTSAGAQQFLHSRDTLLDQIPIGPGYLSQRSLKNLDSPVETIRPEPAVFGDTIALTWDLGKTDHVITTQTMKSALGLVCQWLPILMRTALSQRLLFRGAVSVGEFIRESSTIVGPAVADAASWYEDAQWCGIVATPHCGLLISQAQAAPGGFMSLEQDDQNLGAVWTGPSVVEYPVPVRGNRTTRLYAVCWPLQYLTTASGDRRQARAAFLTHLEQFPVPKGTEDKYENAVQFFDWVMDHYPLKYHPLA